MTNATNRRTRLLGYSGDAKAVALTPIAALTGGGDRVRTV
jgi:hypothetical protein